MNSTLLEMFDIPKRNLPLEPEATLNSFGCSVNTYRALAAVLQEDDLCREFNSLPCPDWHGRFPGTSEGQEIWLDARAFEATSGTLNSYNWENNFDQLVQYTLLERDQERYVLLQVPGPRGWTSAKLFYVDALDWPWFLCDDATFFLPDQNLTLDFVGSEITAFDAAGRVVPTPDLRLLNLNLKGSAHAASH